MKHTMSMKQLEPRFREIALKYEKKEEAAKAVYRVLCEYATECGMNPDMEVSIRSPEKNKSIGSHACWHVSFEAGDYQWSIWASFTLANKHWYTEPYYSFDLEFTDV